MKRTHERAWRTASIAAPIVMLIAARAVLSGSPSPASGAVPPVGSAGVHPATARLSPAQEGVIAWLRGFDAVSNYPSPFTARLEARSSAPIATPPAAPGARFRLTGVIGAATDDGALASINGRVCRVGMEIAPGVRVVRIAARQREVELRLADGTALVLREQRNR